MWHFETYTIVWYNDNEIRSIMVAIYSILHWWKYLYMSLHYFNSSWYHVALITSVIGHFQTRKYVTSTAWHNHDCGNLDVSITIMWRQHTIASYCITIAIITKTNHYHLNWLYISVHIEIEMKWISWEFERLIINPHYIPTITYWGLTLIDAYLTNHTKYTKSKSHH